MKSKEIRREGVFAARFHARGYARALNCASLLACAPTWACSQASLARKTPCATFVNQLKLYTGSIFPCRVLSSPNAQAFYYSYLYQFAEAIIEAKKRVKPKKRGNSTPTSFNTRYLVTLFSNTQARQFFSLSNFTQTSVSYGFQV